MRNPNLSSFDARWIFLGVTILFYLPHLTAPNEFFLGQDTLAVGYANKSLAHHAMTEERQLPLWNPRPYCGVPFLASLSMGLLYPTGLLYGLFPTPFAMTLGFFLHTLLAGTGVYALSGRLVRRPEARLFAALVYAFSGDLVTHIHAGHDGKIFVMSWTPWAFLCLMRAVEGKRSSWILFSGILALCFLSPHIQCTYYLVLACGLYITHRYLVQEQNIRAWLRSSFGLTLSCLAAAALALPQLLPAWHLSRISTRGVLSYEHATFFSMPWEELLDLFIPSFTGEADGYWGSRLFKHYTHYMGAFTLILACLGSLREKKNRGTWVMLFVFGLIMALGGNTPLYRLPYQILPLVKKMRSPETIHFLCTLSVCMLSSLGFETLIETAFETWSRTLRRLVAAMAVPGLLCLHPWLYRSFCLFFFGRGWDPSRVDLLDRNAPFVAADAVVFLCLLAGIWFLCRLKGSGTLSSKAWILATLLITTGDLWRLDLRYLKTLSPETAFPKDPVLEKLQSQPGRVLQIDPSTFGFPYTYGHLGVHSIETLGGYQNLSLRWTDQLMDLCKENPSRVLDLMHCQFILSSRKDIPRVLDANKILETERAALFERPPVPPRHRLAQKTTWCETEGEMMAAILAPDLNPWTDAVLLSPGSSRTQIQEYGTGSLWLAERNSGRRIFSVESEHPCFLVLSETFHPHWQARVDHVPTPIFRTNGAFMGIEIQQGARRVEVRFLPPWMFPSILASLSLTFILSIAWCLLALRERDPRRTTDPTDCMACE